uniref:immunoglobulin-like domain-containing protein n=1 Tax=Roseburia hominis TaxID=301301 RepID=UPI003FF0460D
MKKKSVVVLLTVTMVTEMTAAGCGDKQLALATDRVSVELGYELNTDVAAYVADADIAVETTIDFGAVDVSKLGTYTAVVTYKDQTASLEVDVVDTTAPEAEVVNQVTVGVDEPLYVEDVLTSVTELTGNVMATFDDLADESTEATEEVEATEGVEAAKDVETTEDMEVTEEVEATGASEDMETFVLDDVTVTNDAIVFHTVGEYSVSLTLADESGNSKQVEVPVLVGTEPTFLGIEDLTVTTGAENVDYLSGVTATDSNGNDLTDKIECDDSKADLSLAGEYEITYTVTDENGFTAKQTAKVTVADGKTSKKDTKSATTKSETTKAETGSTNSSNGGSSNSGSSNSGNSNSGSSNSGNSNSGSSNSGDNSGNSNSGSSNSGDNSGNSNSGSSNSGDNSGSSNSGGGNSGNSNSGSSNNESSNFGNSNSESTTPSGDSGSSNNGSGDHTMSEPDDVIEGDPSLGDNTGTGGNGGGNSTITFN